MCFWMVAFSDEMCSQRRKRASRCNHRALRTQPTAKSLKIERSKLLFAHNVIC